MNALRCLAFRNKHMERYLQVIVFHLFAEYEFYFLSKNGLYDNVQMDSVKDVHVKNISSR